MKELFNKIGIKTLGDLERFKKEIVKEDESIIEALERYVEELGTDFEIKEEE